MQGQEDLNRKEQNQAWKTVIMTSYQEAIHMTLVWLSFWNEFIPSSYNVFFSIPKWHFAPVQVIPVFILDEIDSFWYEI